MVGRKRRVFRDLRHAKDFLAVALQMTLLVKALDQHAERAGLVLEVEQDARLWVGLARQVGINAAQGGMHRHGFLELQRAPRDDVDGARGAAFIEFGLGGLVHHDFRNGFSRQQAVIDAASDGRGLVEDEPVAAGQRVAVDLRERHAGRRTAQADTVVLVEAAFTRASGLQLDARDRLQGVGHVLGRQLADVFRCHDVDVGNSGLLQLQGQRRRVSNADDGDGVERLGLLFLRLLLLRLLVGFLLRRRGLLRIGFGGGHGGGMAIVCARRAREHQRRDDTCRKHGFAVGHGSSLRGS